MNHMSWKDKKEKVKNLIKEISDYYGDDDEQFLEDYFQELLEKHNNNLDPILTCFEDLYNNLPEKR